MEDRAGEERGRWWFEGELEGSSLFQDEDRGRRHVDDVSSSENTHRAQRRPL